MAYPKIPDLQKIVNELSLYSQLKHEYGAIFPLAHRLSRELANGPTVNNVGALCELLATHDEESVREAVGRLSSHRRQSPRRRLAYLRAMLASD